MKNEKGLERIRHTLKFRICAVVSKTFVTPKLIRIALRSPDLDGFRSDGFDDHVKLFFPAQGEEIVRPIAGPNGMQFPEGHLPPEGRDFTPRFFDPATQTLTLDFVVHEDGPATNWAKRAVVGDQIGVGGPRASFVLRGAFDWHLLIGDETALPAIARRIEELPASEKAIALVQVAEKDEIQTLKCSDNVKLTWLTRDKTQDAHGQLLQAARELHLPDGDGYIFIAGEADAAKALREIFVDARGHNPDWIKAAGYWRRDAADFYDGHEH